MPTETLFLLPFMFLFFVWVATFINMMNYRSLYNRACARETRWKAMVDDLTAALKRTS